MSCPERALLEANDRAPHLSGPARDLISAMPRRTLASQNVRAITLRPSVSEHWLADAITCPWFCPNSRRRVNALLIDIDHADGPEMVAMLPSGCPKPTLVIDPHSGRAHAILPLATPVLTGEGARPGPQGLARRTLLLMAAALRGTPLPYLSQVKSPWGLEANLIGSRRRGAPEPATPAVWEAYQEHAQNEGRNALMWVSIPGSGPAELRDIIDALEDEYGEQIDEQAQSLHWRKRSSVCAAEAVEGMRNVALFDAVRRWAYDSGEQDESAIQAEAC